MKKKKYLFFLQFILILSLFTNFKLAAQCLNADFETGDFTGWTGSWGLCTSAAGNCTPITNWPYLITGFNQGANNAPATAPQNHFITTAGFDGIVGGTLLPVVYPGAGATSMRLGNAVAKIGEGDGEFVSYSFKVDSSNANFTYHYAVVVNSGNHLEKERPYFNIQMYDSSANIIPCASYNLNDSTANSIKGFATFTSGFDLILWKAWSSVSIPLKNYMGQTVKITFETRHCLLGATPAGHWAYAYIDASCAPLKIISSSPATCVGKFDTLTAPIGYATYKWVAPSTGSIVSSDSTNVAIINAPGTYTVTLTTFGNIPCSYNLTITIPPNSPGLGIGLNSTTICTGESTTLTTLGAAPYLWAPGGQTTNFITVTPGFTTTYTVTATDNVGCTAKGTGTITVNQLQDAGFSYNSTTVCSNSSNPTPKITGVTGGTFTCSPAASINSTNGTIDLATTTVGTYTITYTTPGPCQNSQKFVLTIVGKQVADFSYETYCKNAANPLPTFINSGTAGTFSSTAGTNLVFTSTTSGKIDLAASTPGTYTVTNVLNIPGCTATSFSNTITINPVPVIAVNSKTICTGSFTTLTASGAVSYSWSNGSLANTITDAPISAKTYTVIGNSAGCTSAATATITVNPIPVVTANNITICEGAKFILMASGAVSYVWSNTKVGNTLVDSATTSVSYSVTGTSNGCASITSANVTVNPKPIVKANSTTICEGLTSILTASGANSYMWSNNATINPLTVSPNKTTQYTVTGTNTKGCKAMGTNKITVFPTPVANFSTSPQPALASFPTITFTDKSSIDVNYWHWDFGDGDTLSPNTKNTVHTYPTVEATYSVTLNVLNAGLCPNSITHQVVLGPEYSFFIPNAFSPNGDGINDTFFGKGKGIIQYELMIFDRWGNFIFYADDMNKGWDGKINGSNEVLLEDTYIWKVNLTDIFNKKNSFTGTVILLNGK